MEQGRVHIYFGNGKGKTTAGVGLCVRAAGAGKKVLFYQFMKDNKTSERTSLAGLKNITMVDGLNAEKFSFQLTDSEKMERKKFYESQLVSLMKMAVEEGYDLLFLDEIIYTIAAGLLEEEMVLSYLKKPIPFELVLTGNPPSSTLLQAADYASEIVKKKHPYDCGGKARIGIEK